MSDIVVSGSVGKVGRQEGIKREQGPPLLISGGGWLSEVRGGSERCSLCAASSNDVIAHLSHSGSHKAIRSSGTLPRWVGRSIQVHFQNISIEACETLNVTLQNALRCSLSSQYTARLVHLSQLDNYALGTEYTVCSTLQMSRWLAVLGWTRDIQKAQHRRLSKLNSGQPITSTFDS